MVSLKSFKLINEVERDEAVAPEIDERQQYQSSRQIVSLPSSNQETTMVGKQEDSGGEKIASPSPSSSSISIVIVNQNDTTSPANAANANLVVAHRNEAEAETETDADAEAEVESRTTISRSVIPEGEHFEIIWSNLGYRIEPKWYKRINLINHFMSGQTVDNHSSATSTASSSAGMNDDQHQMHATEARPKSSLDPIEIFTNLNGTIKSGQMTAVLGPSGEYSPSALEFRRSKAIISIVNRAWLITSFHTQGRLPIFGVQPDLFYKI